ncbi:hypothetical protein Q7P37_008238 [Cladosporium fusiforme]
MTSSGDSSPQVPIAIVGLGCRFPGDADSPKKFWDILKEGRDAYSPRTDRWNPDAFYHPNKDRANTQPTKGGHFLKQDPYVFDPSFFNITATEAIALDPKQRLALEVAYEALENAGFPIQKVAGSQTACYMGSAMADYRDSISRDFGHAPKYFVLGTCEEMISNRISHFFDMHGPSATVHTACSSSLVATHVACQSLRSGEADMALAGGVGIMLTPDSSLQLNNMSFLNPEGHSRSFDADAGGYARGEGCGILVMKRLDDAVRDGDNIRAVIRGSGVNSDGWTQGVTMPSPEAQAALIRQVFGRNKLDYDTIQYVEAHGTGTKAGDPVETKAIYDTIGRGINKSRKLWIGSVKPNIGHLEAAAGVAGIIKGVLSLENNAIPPNIYFSKPNPAIKLDEWNMAVPTKLVNWPVAQTKRMTVSGFGMGGTNGLVVLEAYVPERLLNGATKVTTAKDTAHSGKRLFVCSSQDQAGFKRIGEAFVDHLDNVGPIASSSGYLANLAHTLSTARAGLSWRTTFVADSKAELREHLATTLGQDATRVSDTQAQRIGFVFTGQGAQWAGMGVEMLERPVFGASVAKSAELLRSFGCTWDPATELQKAAKESRLAVPEISQPICTIIQIALVDELKSWGVSPAKVVGHSSGEIAAAYTIGALSHRDAMAVAYFRGMASTALKTSAPHLEGGMMAVGTSAEDAQTIIAETKNSISGDITIACVNSPSSVTLSGDAKALEELRKILDARSVFARRLKVDVAYHSSHMNVAAPEYQQSIADIEPRLCCDEVEEENLPVMVSSVTTEQVSSELLGTYYWIRNLVSPVQFSDALRELVAPGGSNKNDVDLLIEIGPHSALGGPVEQILSFHNIQKVDYKSVLTRGQNALDTSLSLASDLFVRGIQLDMEKVNGDSDCHLLNDLPSYPWNHSKAFRADSRIQRELLQSKHPRHSMIGLKQPMLDETQHVWRNYVRLTDEPWLRGHVVGGTALVPGAGMLSMVFEAVQQLVDPGKPAHSLRVRDVKFSAALTLPEDTAIEVVTTLRPHLVSTSGSTPASWWEFTISSCPGTDQIQDNCRGLVAIEYTNKRSDQMIYEDVNEQNSRIADFHRVRDESPLMIRRERFYEHMQKSGYNYGETFQGMDTVHLGDGETAFHVKLVDIGETFSKGQLDRPFLIPGSSLDAIFQSIFGSTFKNGAFEVEKPNFLAYIGELEISLDIPGEVGYVMPGVCFSRKHGFNQQSADIFTFDNSLSRMHLAVRDFRMTEPEVGDDASDGLEPWAFTSAPHWNYAFSLLKTEELRSVLSKVTTQDAPVELLRTILHENPSASVLELIPEIGDLAVASSYQLPKGAIQPSQLRYAVAKDSPDSFVEENLVGGVFALDGVGEPDQKISADVLIVPSSLDVLEDRDAILARFLKLAGPAALIITASGSHSAGSVFEAHGFQAFPGLNDIASLPGLYSHAEEPSLRQTNRGTRDTSDTDIIILEPSSPSSNTTKFSKTLSSRLEDQNYSVTIRKWAGGETEEFQNTTYISLLELEQPFLDNLSGPDFQGIKNLILGSNRLIWLTLGNDPSFGAVDGLSRVMRSELGTPKFQVMHLSGEGGLQSGPELTVRVLKSSTEDTEFRERDGLLQVIRIFESPDVNQSLRGHLENSTRILPIKQLDHPVRLTVGKPGFLDSLQFIKDRRTEAPLPENEIEIETHASGVNFRDVMASMGLISTPILGFEASGVVTKCGSQVSQFRTGARVSFVGEHTHSTKIRADPRLVAPIPDNVSFEDAASLPIVGATAYHTLTNLARLRKGQTILIHAAAGGVGQAMIQLASHFGLVIYATVGTEDKRKLLGEKYNIPPENILNSRDASFAKGIKRLTGGRGVDCVINSLSGELLRASWGCVAPFGIFIELGLRDITDNMRLDMRPFSNVTSFTFCNILALMQQDPDAMGLVLKETFKLVSQGILTSPFPTTVFPVEQAQEAFRLMQQGKHRGKLVLSFAGDPQAPVYCEAKESLLLDGDATYLIIGGLGGLGRSMALELVASGARHLAFISRSGDSTPQAKATLAELEQRNLDFRVYRGDVSNEESFLDAMKRCSSDLPPIKGVIQMAMVLKDIIFEKMTHEQWTIPLLPKIQGTWNIHQYFDESRPLDFMVFCSSTSGIHGYPSQSQYAAGNTYQDTLSAYRRAHGLKAVAVNLTIIREVGILAEQGTTGNIAVWEEALGIKEPAFHALMKTLIAGQQGPAGSEFLPPQVSTGLGTADIMSSYNLALPDYFQDPRFGPLAVPTFSTNVGGDSQSAAVSLSSKLIEATNVDQASEIITEGLVTKVADMLQIPVSEVDASRPMYRYGVDSLVALEVRNWIVKEMKATIALLEILAAVPMNVLAKTIASRSKHLAATLD